MANARPDGYTLLMQGITDGITPHLFRTQPYWLKQFIPMGRVALAPMIIVANSGFGLSSMEELLAFVRTSASPVFYGFSGASTVTHLASEAMRMRVAVPLTHVPYKGVSQTLTDVMGNQVPLAVPAIASTLPQLKASKLQAIAVTSVKRSPLLLNVPAVSESLGLAGFDVSSWNGLLALGARQTPS